MALPEAGFQEMGMPFLSSSAQMQRAPRPQEMVEAQYGSCQIPKSLCGGELTPTSISCVPGATVSVPCHLRGLFVTAATIILTNSCQLEFQFHQSRHSIFPVLITIYSPPTRSINTTESRHACINKHILHSCSHVVTDLTFIHRYRCTAYGKLC